MAGSNLIGAAGLAPKVLASTQLAATTATTVYTAPGSGSAVVRHGALCNTGAVVVNVTVSVVPVGGTADGTHRIISALPLAAGDTLSLATYLGGACLGPGDFISVTASVANAIDVILTGVEST